MITTDDPNGSPKRCKFQQNYELAFARNQHILCHQVGVQIAKLVNNAEAGYLTVKDSQLLRKQLFHGCYHVRYHYLTLFCFLFQTSGTYIS